MAEGVDVGQLTSTLALVGLSEYVGGLQEAQQSLAAFRTAEAQSQGGSLAPGGAEAAAGAQAQTAALSQLTAARQADAGAAAAETLAVNGTAAATQAGTAATSAALSPLGQLTAAMLQNGATGKEAADGLKNMGYSASEVKSGIAEATAALGSAGGQIDQLKLKTTAYNETEDALGRTVQVTTRSIGDGTGSITARVVGVDALAGKTTFAATAEGDLGKAATLASSAAQAGATGIKAADDATASLAQQTRAGAQAMGVLGGNLGGVPSLMSGVGAGALTATAGIVVLGLAAVATTGYIVAQGVELQDSTAQLQAWGNLTQTQAQQVTAAFVAQRGTVESSAAAEVSALATVAPQLELVNQQTLTVAQSTQFMAAATALAQASGQGLQSSTSGLSQVMLTYGQSTGQAAGDAGLLLAAQELTGASSEQLAQVIGRLHDRFGPLAPDLQQTVQLMVQFEEAGVTGSRGIMVLSTGIDHLMASGKDTEAELKTLKIDLYDSAGQMKSWGELFPEITAGLSGMSDQERVAAEQALFGATAGAAWDAVIRQGAQGASQAAAAIQQHSDVMAQSATRTETLSGDLGKLKTVVQDTAGAIGSELAGNVQKAEVLLGDAGSAASAFGSAVHGVTGPLADAGSALRVVVGLVPQLAPLATVADAVGGALGRMADGGNKNIPWMQLALTLLGPMGAGLQLAGLGLDKVTVSSTASAKAMTDDQAATSGAAQAYDALTEHLSTGSNTSRTYELRMQGLSAAVVAADAAHKGLSASVQTVITDEEKALTSTRDLAKANGFLAATLGAVGEMFKLLPTSTELATDAANRQSKAYGLQTQEMQATAQGHTALAAALEAERQAVLNGSTADVQLAERNVQLAQTGDAVDKTQMHQADSLQSVTDALIKAGQATDDLNTKYDALVSGSFLIEHDISQQSIDDAQKRGDAEYDAAVKARDAWAGFNATYLQDLANEAAAIQAGDVAGADYWKNQAAQAKASGDTQKDVFNTDAQAAEKYLTAAHTGTDELEKAQATAAKDAVTNQAALATATTNLANDQLAKGQALTQAQLDQDKEKTASALQSAQQALAAWKAASDQETADAQAGNTARIADDKNATEEAKATYTDAANTYHKAKQDETADSQAFAAQQKAEAAATRSALDDNRTAWKDYFSAIHTMAQDLRPDIAGMVSQSANALIGAENQLQSIDQQLQGQLSAQDRQTLENRKADLQGWISEYRAAYDEAKTIAGDWASYETAVTEAAKREKEDYQAVLQATAAMEKQLASDAHSAAETAAADAKSIAEAQGKLNDLIAAESGNEESITPLPARAAPAATQAPLEQADPLLAAQVQKETALKDQAQAVLDAYTAQGQALADASTKLQTQIDLSQQLLAAQGKTSTTDAALLRLELTRDQAAAAGQSTTEIDKQIAAENARNKIAADQVAIQNAGLEQQIAQNKAQQDQVALAAGANSAAKQQLDDANTQLATLNSLVAADKSRIDADNAAIGAQNAAAQGANQAAQAAASAASAADQKQKQNASDAKQAAQDRINQEKAIGEAQKAVADAQGKAQKDNADAAAKYAQDQQSGLEAIGKAQAKLTSDTQDDAKKISDAYNKVSEDIQAYITDPTTGAYGQMRLGAEATAKYMQGEFQNTFTAMETNAQAAGAIIAQNLQIGMAGGGAMTQAAVAALAGGGAAPSAAPVLASGTYTFNLVLSDIGPIAEAVAQAIGGELFATSAGSAPGGP